MCKLTEADLTRHSNAVSMLKKLKKEELELRNKIINHFRYKDVEGVQHKELDGIDCDIVVTLKLNRVLNEDIVNTNWTDLTQKERDAVEYKPKLNLKEYKTLVENDEADLLMNAVTEKPGQASLVLKFGDG